MEEEKAIYILTHRDKYKDSSIDEAVRRLHRINAHRLAINRKMVKRNKKLHSVINRMAYDWAKLSEDSEIPVSAKAIKQFYLTEDKEEKAQLCEELFKGGIRKCDSEK